MAALIIALLLVYPIWALIHEGSHALVARGLGAEILTFKPWPNKALGRLTWGSVQWRGGLTSHERGLVSIAPRAPALLATIALPVLVYSGAPDFVSVLFAGGLVDQVVNSLGINENSDLQEWCRSFTYNNPWYWRAIGLTTALMFGGVALLIRLHVGP